MLVVATFAAWKRFIDSPSRIQSNAREPATRSPWLIRNSEPRSIRWASTGCHKPRRPLPTWTLPASRNCSSQRWREPLGCTRSVPPLGFEV